jgi:hypothetical protein
MKDESSSRRQARVLAVDLRRESFDSLLREARLPYEEGGQNTAPAPQKTLFCLPLPPLPFSFR